MIVLETGSNYRLHVPVETGSYLVGRERVFDLVLAICRCRFFTGFSVTFLSWRPRIAFIRKFALKTRSRSIFATFIFDREIKFVSSTKWDILLWRETTFKNCDTKWTISIQNDQYIRWFTIEASVVMRLRDRPNSQKYFSFCARDEFFYSVKNRMSENRASVRLKEQFPG